MTLDFVTHTPVTAPVESRSALEHAARAFGRVPPALGRLAESPLVIESFEALKKLFEKTSFDAVEREVVILMIAHHNGCHVCTEMHGRLLASKRRDERLVGAAVRGGPIGDERLEALRRFTESVLVHRGDVPDEERAAFAAAGFSAAQALEVVLGVAAYTLTTYGNRLTRAPL